MLSIKTIDKSGPCSISVSLSVCYTMVFGFHHRSISRLENMDPILEYFLYRGADSTNEQIIKAIVEATKDYIFDENSIILTSKGYSGIPLKGKSSLGGRRDDLWKIIDVLFQLSQHFDGLVFSITTNEPKENLFFRECERNEVLPTWIQSPADFNNRVYGYGGVLHLVTPQVKDKYQNTLDIDIIRRHSRETRNIIITEAVKQRINVTASKEFGVKRSSVNLPYHLAYIAKQRPDLLSAAIREYIKSTNDHSRTERLLDLTECVMVHVCLNSRDFKSVMAVADIESPSDIVSHRIGCALLEFDEKYSSCQNGAIDETDETFRNVEDAFERERMSSLMAAIRGKPQSLAHRYQMAKSLLTNKHHAECRKLFNEGVTSSSDARDTACSGDDEDDNRRTKQPHQKKQVYKKKRGDLGKKRELAVLPKSLNAPRAPSEDELPTPTTSGQLRNFERAVNGDDIYKESSDEKSLGEEEASLDLFSKKSKIKLTLPKMAAPHTLSENGTATDDDGGFDVSDLLNSAPPLAAKLDDFEDFDDI